MFNRNMKNKVNRTLAVKKNALKSLFIVMGCLVASTTVFAAAPAVTITAKTSAIGDWNKTYNAGTPNEIKISVVGADMAEKKPCGTSTKENTLSISSSDSHYLTFELAQGSTATIDSILFRSSGNSSGTSDWFSPLFLCTETTFNTDNVAGVKDIHFTGYDQSCTDQMAKLTADTKSCRLYRRAKYTPGTPGKVGSGSNYGSGQTMNITYIEIYLSGGTPVKSSDATLSALVYGSDQTSVPNFSPNTLNYEVELPANYVGGAPSVQPTTTHSAATITSITQATTIPGTATIVVTAEDGTTTKTYTVTFTKATSAPKVLTATWPNIKGTAVVDQVNLKITGQVTNGSSISAITPSFTGNNIVSWTPTGAQDFSAFPINYRFSSATGETTTYEVTITEAPAMSTDATLKSLTYNGTSVPNFSPTTYVYNIELAANATVPTVAAVANDSKATVVVTQASGLPGVAKVLVTAEDNTVTQTYTINFTVAVPPTSLTIHKPETYEAKGDAGYGGKLSTFDSREYEVYYCSYTEKDDTLSITISPAQKSAGITKGDTKTSFHANDGWFKGEAANGKSNYTFTKNDEFEAGEGALHKLLNGNEYQFHIEGYDQFSIMGKDNNADASKGRHLEVYVDNVLQQMTLSTSYTIRRFNITTGRHLIRVKAKHDGSSNSELNGFSLRIPQEPKTKRLKGNDSTQVVLQTMAVRPVTYVTKYNNIPGAETKLEWKGAEATGIELQKREGSLADTLVLRGTVTCPVGVYNYAVVSYLNGVETSRAEGKFTVKSDIMTLSPSADAKVYTNEEMDPIQFQYYALNATDVKLTWENNQAPAGIAGKGTTAGKYEISGTPTTKGTYKYSITVTDADTTIKGTITVEELNYGNDPVLYLFKNDNAPDKDGVYKYLTSQGKNLIKRKAKEEGLRPVDQYANYKWVLISEDVDADNPEVLALARGQGGLPVLNMKSFTYTEGRLNWGEPDNGSLSQNGCYITVQRDDHPIFKALKMKRGDQIMVLDTIIRKGLMPINVNYSGTLCLATALTRDKEDYYGDGPEQTILHEVPASMNFGQKYICLPIGAEGSNRLTDDGKKLIDQCIKYILSNEATITVPQIAITKFKIGSYEANNIDDGNHLIEINVAVQDSDAMKAATPEITLASPLTFYTADKQYVNADGTVDFSNWHYGVRYVVSDYINSWYYDVVINLYDPHEGIENIEVGTWVNIYDIYGRKVATTNEDLRTMALPQGMYIVVTEDGQTTKIFK